MDLQANRILKEELSRRCAKNPRYSLRSFAQQLGISPANLSLLLNSKRLASSKTIEQILKQVSLSPVDRDSLVNWANGTAKAIEENLDLATADKICNWTCYTILSLTLTAGFQSNIGWIARKIGITIHEARHAIDLLVSAGKLEVSAKPWKATENLRINNQVSTLSIRQFHRDLLAKAMLSMENDPTEKREISSMSFAMSPEKMSQAKQLIRQFRVRMSELLEEPGKSTEVYHLSVQLTPATQPISRRKK